MVEKSTWQDVILKANFNNILTSGMAIGKNNENSLILSTGLSIVTSIIYNENQHTFLVESVEIAIVLKDKKTYTYHIPVIQTEHTPLNKLMNTFYIMY